RARRGASARGEAHARRRLAAPGGAVVTRTSASAGVDVRGERVRGAGDADRVAPTLQPRARQLRLLVRRGAGRLPERDRDRERAALALGAATGAGPDHVR